jgi:hypothetical protein
MSAEDKITNQIKKELFISGMGQDDRVSQEIFDVGMTAYGNFIITQVLDEINRFENDYSDNLIYGYVARTITRRIRRIFQLSERF